MKKRRQFIQHSSASLLACSLIASLLPVFTAALAFSQEQPQLHRIDARSAEGLRELFHYDGATMPLLSAHRGGAVTGGTADRS